MGRPDDAVRTGPRHRSRALAGGALVLVAAGLAWHAQEPAEPASGPPAFPAQAARRTTASADAAPASDQARASAAGPSSGREAGAGLAALPAAPPPLAADGTEVCGLGRMALDDTHAEPTDLLPVAVRDLAWQQVDLALATDADPRARAAAHLIRIRRATRDPAWREAAEADQACRNASRMGMAETAAHCIESQRRRQADLIAPVAAAIDALARLAVLSADPRVLAQAREACAPVGLTLVASPPNCTLVDTARWRQASPDEAEPWLALATEAQARADEPAADAALAQALRAPRWDAHADTLAATVAAMLTPPPGSGAQPPLATLHPPQQTAVLAGLAALADGDAASAASASAAALCADGPLQRPSRRAACDALAHQLIDRGRSAATLEAGLTLAERLGWPADRTGAAWRRHRATLEAVRTWREAGAPLGCDRLQRERRHALAAGRDGDLGAARRLVAAARTARAEEAAPPAPAASVNFAPCPDRTSNCSPPPATPTSASRR